MGKVFNPSVGNFDVSPISGPEFAALLTPILSDHVRHITVAVSGGSDSLALTCLLQRWCENCGVRLSALTVDHQLRPSSGEEAQKISAWLKNLGVDHEVLNWWSEKPKTGIQEAARTARYCLMFDWCRQKGIQDLLLAHHQEDQAETFLMRLSRGSGIEGLACMGRITNREGIRLLRPLLSVPKGRLRATLEVQGQDWLEDPSNSDLVFTRTIMKKLSNVLAERGVDCTRLATLAGQFGKLRGHLEEVTCLAIDRAARIDKAGWATIDCQFLIDLPDEVGTRVVIYLLKCIGGRPYPPRRKRLLRAISMIKKPEIPTAFTLGGCKVSQLGSKLMFLREEWPQTPPLTNLEAGSVKWRGVFLCEFETVSGGSSQVLFLAPLGQKGWEQVVQESPEIKKSGMLHAVALTLPALFGGNRVLMVPHMNYCYKDDYASENRPNLRFVAANFLPLEER